MSATHRDIFDDIYRRGSWGSEETVSGPGSTRARAADFQDDLLALIRRLEVRVLLDAGCGDFNWMAEVAEAVESYLGVDVVPDLVARNVLRHARPGRAFLCRDITADPLPRADLILCRDCLVHFSLADVQAALANFVRSGSVYLLTTTFPVTGGNVEIRTGEWRDLDLEQPPFSFPPPLATVDERCLRGGDRYRSKRFALWALDSLPALDSLAAEPRPPSTGGRVRHRP